MLLAVPCVRFFKRFCFMDYAFHIVYSLIFTDINQCSYDYFSMVKNKCWLRLCRDSYRDDRRPLHHSHIKAPKQASASDAMKNSPVFLSAPRAAEIRPGSPN